MARMPGADWQGAHHDNGLMSRYDIVCIHTIVGNPPAHAAHFSTRADGHIYQSRDTIYRSAANLNGNYRVIAIENDDLGPEFGVWNTNDGHQVPGFTDAQCESIAQICVWANAVHGIPLVLCPDSRSGSRGLAYHRQGIDGNFGTYDFGGRVSGGEIWTTSFGKVCPGDRRIHQLIDVIIPRARQIAGLEADLTPDEHKWLEQTYVQTNTQWPSDLDGIPRTLVDHVRHNEVVVAQLKTMVNILIGMLDMHDAKLAVGISKLMDAIKSNQPGSILTAIKDLQSLILTQGDQATWGDLAGKTWGEVALQKWGKLKIT